MGRIRNTLYTLTTLIALHAVMLGQQYRTITGTVRSGYDKRVMPGVTITITDRNKPSNTQTVITRGDGTFTIDKLTDITEESDAQILLPLTYYGRNNRLLFQNNNNARIEVSVYTPLGQEIPLDKNNYTITGADGNYLLRIKETLPTGEIREHYTSFNKIDGKIYPNIKTTTKTIKQAPHNTKPPTLKKTIDNNITYDLHLSGVDIWNYKTTITTRRDTTLELLVKDKQTLTPEILQRYKTLYRQALGVGNDTDGTVRTLKPLQVYFIIDTTNTIQKPYYEIYKQKAALIQQLQLNPLDTNYCKNKTFTIGPPITTTPPGEHTVYFGDAGSFAAATVIEYNYKTHIVNRAATIYAEILLQSSGGEVILDISFTKEIFTSEVDFGRINDYIGLFNSAVGHAGKDFKNPIDKIMVQSSYMRTPNTRWDDVTQTEIEPGWHNYPTLKKTTENNNYTIVTYTTYDGKTIHQRIEKNLEETLRILGLNSNARH